MSSDTLSSLQNLDPNLLTEIVRRQQNNPAFELLDWSVAPLTHAKIVDTTGGLFGFSGHGRDAQGVRAWALALKINHDPVEWAQGEKDVFYWKRDYLAAQSGILAALPPPLYAPHIYHLMERDGDAWVWMELIVEATERRWSLEHFQFAAHQLGGFAAAYLNGLPLPDQPWLCNSVYRSLLGDGAEWDYHMNPENPGSTWENPTVQHYFPDPLRSGVLAIWADIERFFTALDQLPQVFCHNDCNRRNLMIRTNTHGAQELVAVDWAWCGSGALGLDVGALVATTLFFMDYPPEQAAELEAVVLESYIAGLRAAGWSGDERLARLGYLLNVSLWHGASLPGWVSYMFDEEHPVDALEMYGRSKEAVLEGWALLETFMLERADEARSLMRELNLG